MSAGPASTSLRRTVHPKVTSMPVLPQKELADKHTLQRPYSNILPDLVINMEPSEFEDCRAGFVCWRTSRSGQPSPGTTCCTHHAGVQNQAGEV